LTRRISIALFLYLNLQGMVEILAEKGGSRTLREPYGPQTGFEDQRHHRAPSFSTLINQPFTAAASVVLDSLRKPWEQSR
jgi:hypothetical protein